MAGVVAGACCGDVWCCCCYSERWAACQQLLLLCVVRLVLLSTSVSRAVPSSYVCRNWYGLLRITHHDHGSSRSRVACRRQVCHSDVAKQMDTSPHLSVLLLCHAGYIDCGGKQQTSQCGSPVLAAAAAAAAAATATAGSRQHGRQAAAATAANLETLLTLASSRA